MDRLADSADQLSEQQGDHSSPPVKRNSIYKVYSGLSLGIGIISLGIFSWISVFLLDFWFVSFPVNFFLYSLFIVISLSGIVLGALSLKKREKMAGGYWYGFQYHGYPLAYLGFHHFLSLLLLNPIKPFSLLFLQLKSNRFLFSSL